MTEHLSAANDNPGLAPLIRLSIEKIVRRLTGTAVVALGLITMMACGAAVFYTDWRRPDVIGLAAAGIGTLLTMVILAAAYAFTATYLRYKRGERSDAP